MPELPEVQTIVSDLNKVLPGLKITSVWSEHERAIKYPKKFKNFEKEIVGERVLSVERRGKNVLINLSHNRLLLIHQKMTGHLLYGKFQIQNSKVQINPKSKITAFVEAIVDKQNLKIQSKSQKVKNDSNGVKWVAIDKGALRDDPKNGFIRHVFSLSDGKQLVLSDMRKFAKIMAGERKKVLEVGGINELGAEPLEKAFTFKKFTEIFKKPTKTSKIKQILMAQNLVVGIGNIYADEILWAAGIHPLRPIGKIKEDEWRKIYDAIKTILKKSVRLRGDSNVDYRDAFGKMGGYQNHHKAYQMTGTKCQKNDGGVIEKIKAGGRGTHFCPIHQK